MPSEKSRRDFLPHLLHAEAQTNARLSVKLANASAETPWSMNKYRAPQSECAINYTLLVVAEKIRIGCGIVIALFDVVEDVVGDPDRGRL